MRHSKVEITHPGRRCCASALVGVVGALAVALSLTITPSEVFGQVAVPSTVIGQFGEDGHLSLDLWPAAGDDDRYEQHSLSKQLGGPIYRKLEETTSCDFVNTPLSEVLEFFRRQHDILIIVDHSELKNVGYGVDDLLTCRSHDLRLRTTLDLLLDGWDLTWIVGDGYLLVTTAEAAEERMETHVYPVLDLVHTAGGMDYDTLVNLIHWHVEPTSWPIGNQGPDAFAGSLVIAQTQRVHEQIGDLLAMLRLALRQSTGDGVYTVVARHDARRLRASAGEHAERQASDHIRTKLNEPVTFDFNDVEMSAVVELLRDQHGIPVQVDQLAWWNADVSLDVRITFHCEDIPLRSAMRLMLTSIDIDWLIGNGYLWLTSREEAEDLVETRVYPVGDLLAGDGGAPGYIDQLQNVLRTAIAPESWGGVGAVSALDELLVVTQTQPNHGQIERLLADVRANANITVVAGTQEDGSE